jgi:hypothetical protein
MKKLLFFVCISSIFWSACNKNDDSPVLTYFKYKADGVSFQRDSLEFPADNLVEGNLDLKFENGDRSLILGVIEFYGKEGSYDVNWVDYDNGTSDFYGDSGTVIITEINIKREYISGTFTASCSPLGGGTEVQITEGEFVMKYIDL